MTPLELRQKYLDFFEKKGHSIIPSVSLVPENDPTVLFTTAGMHPLVPFLLGEKHPSGKRLAGYQKCIRTADIDEVGDDWHLTFFEMLGNWSLGDPASPDGIGKAGYFKKEAITWSYEFLTEELKIPSDKLAVSVFIGDKDAPFDQESFDIWKSLGIPEEKIFKYGKVDNWWGPAGKTGPCGPDTEMFYITDKVLCGSNCQPNDNCGRYDEIWNDVFMEYNKTSDEKYIPLKQKNVDTGMGLERTIAILNSKDNVYETDFFKPIIEKIQELTKLRNEKSERIIADHLRAACFILTDGIIPSNLDQGYVLRRLIRRSIRQGKTLGIPSPFIHNLAEVIIANDLGLYSELNEKRKLILDELEKEEKKFSKTLEKGLKIFQKEHDKIKNLNQFSGKIAFNLYQTYGFPLEIIEEELKGVSVNKKEFEEEFKKHQALSKKGSEKKFSGGLADHSEKTIKLHTATHLLQAALEKVLGNHVEQRGSNITPERLRFDFSHPEKLTLKQIKLVEDLVNEQIKKNLPVSIEEMTVEEAKQKGAIGFFEQKYGGKVKVYQIGNFSKEICGGPHIKNTQELEKFKIIKEEAVSAGIRRIKAKLE